MKIYLNDKIGIDLSKLIEGRMLIQANSGGGKSHTTRRIIEQAAGHVQIIVLDPEGEYSNLRSKYDFIYAGKDGDTPAEPRSAALLARRLLELNASAIIDLYELAPGDRRHFVRLFCESMVNAPKELWHDVLVIIDEAHIFAPENGESEAMGAVIDLATRGRKRGYCAILATQRISKLNKDAAAECNNKLLGRTILDIDRKRAGDELGFTTKDQFLSLRDLDPGQFYVWGPAISKTVEKITVGDVVVKPPKRGISRSAPPKPTDAVKRILAQLSDLPAEAQQEANSMAALKRENIGLKQQLKTRPKQDPDALKKVTDKAFDLGIESMKHQIKKNDKSWQEIVDAANKTIKRMADNFASISKLTEIYKSVPVFGQPINEQPDTKEFYTKSPASFEDSAKKVMRPILQSPIKAIHNVESAAGLYDTNEPKSLSKGARQILTYLHNCYPSFKSKAQLWIATVYAPGGGFNNYIYELTGAKLIEKDGTGSFACIEPVDPPLLDPNFEINVSKWDEKLSLGARKIFNILYENTHEVYSKEQLSEMTNYAMGGGFNNYIYELTGKELIVRQGIGYTLNPEVLDL